MFRDDFEAERKDREHAHNQMEVEKTRMFKEIQTLQTTVQQKNRELQQKDQQLATHGGKGGNKHQTVEAASGRPTGRTRNSTCPNTRIQDQSRSLEKGP